ncbi:MAG: DUF4241 domain-containing protein [Ruminococcaceae bacterium]|nr:DUF4241 domain-containing protein [Oscillospiraceae bacterium]
MYMNTELLLAVSKKQLEPYCGEGEEFIFQPMGELRLPTGEIVANDPCCMFETKPFTRKVPAGAYPAEIWVLHSADDDKRIAFAALRFSDAEAVSFEMAIVDGVDVSKMEENEYFGYGVDAGTGCFMDAAACKVLLAAYNEDYELPVLAEPLEASYVDTYSAANVELGEGQNIVAFSTGWGDGAYPSYWGLDKDCEICCLITDFCIVE